jgi:hypothetical protein
MAQLATHSPVKLVINSRRSISGFYGLHCFSRSEWHWSSIYLSIYLRLYSPCGPWPLFQFPNLYTLGRTPWTGDQPFARPLLTNRTRQTQNKRKQTSMPLVGIEPPIPVFYPAETVNALDRAPVVIGNIEVLFHYIRMKVMLNLFSFVNW